ncbi:hypothetical protein ACFCYN_14205 [Gottfriedia sp. NPDC056225]|uniref:hypothetical protein n=1 Tax=Gottfriedia sp. NPDC056225 TaxID=3345751 RepID=UPI0035D73029
MKTLTDELADEWASILFIIIFFLMTESKWEKHEINWWFWLGLISIIVFMTRTIIKITKSYKHKGI